MNISDLNASALRSDQLRNSSVARIDPASRGRTVSDEKTEANADRVEISDKAREALSDARSTEELSFARKALDNVPELSEERTAQIQDRIKSGYYNRADVLNMVAERLGSDVAAG